MQYDKKNCDTRVTELYRCNSRGNQNETIDAIVFVDVNIVENKTPIIRQRGMYSVTLIMLQICSQMLRTAYIHTLEYIYIHTHKWSRDSK